MRTTLFFIMLLIAGSAPINPAHCQSKDVPADLYIASAIPDSLKINANAVVRYRMKDIVAKSPGHATIKEHTIVTLLNEKAKDEAEIEVGYDKKFNSVSEVQMIVYDANGKLIKKYKKGDMYDRAAYDGFSIITDDRVIGTVHTVASYPVTIEQIKESDLNSSIDLGSWHIMQPEFAVQNTACHILVNPAIGFRYRNKNTTISPQKTTVNNMDSYTWEVKNVKAVKLEEGALDWQVLPKINFATNAFEYGGMPGDFTSWKTYGKWQAALNADVCALKPEREQEIRTMMAGIKTDKEKVKFLYQYLQHNMRYVSIQLGIGGLKPFAATFVDQKKYGDCKALANYMTAMLKAVNIPSYFSIVRAGANEEPADADFPNDNFNHIIVCVPLKGDTTWLECTDMRQPFGRLGTFTENRNAVLVTEDGGKLVNTPKSNIADNRFNSHVNISLSADGGAKVDLKILATGGYRDEYLYISDQKTDERKNMLIRHLHLKQPAAFELLPAADNDGVKEVAIKLEYDKFCDIAAGDKLFYHPALFDTWQVTLPPEEKRKTDYYFEHPMQKTCITTIALPDGYGVESMPGNTSLKFTYGNFDISYVYDAVKNQVVSTANFNMTNYRIPAAKYNEMQQYMDDIAKAQNKKLVIKKKA
jgi:hypothetical protein